MVRKSESISGAAESRTVKHGVSRLLPYAPPWLWLAIIGVIAAVVHAFYPAEDYWFAPVLIMLAHQGAAWVSWSMTKHKGLTDVQRVLAMSSLAVSCVFMIGVNALGFVSGWVGPFAGIGGSFAMFWTIRRMHLTGDTKAVANAAGGVVGDLVQTLQGAKLGTPKQLESGAVVVPFEVDRASQTVEDMLPVVKTFERVSGLRPNAGKLVPDTNDSGAGEMRFFPKDILEHGVPWQGPSSFGGSIAEPFPVAKRIDTTTVFIYLTGDEAKGRNAVQWLFTGMNGAGKSKAMQQLLGDASTRTQVSMFVHDHVKADVTVKPLLEGGAIEWLSTTIEDGKAMLAAVRGAIKPRMMYLSREHDAEQWFDGCGLNVVLVWLEEATDLGNMKSLAQIAREARAAGIYLFVSMQRASYDNLDTTTRAQLSGNVCFGVESETDATFGLGKNVINLGAHPELWGNKRGGYVYISAPGIEDEDAAVEARWMLAKRDQVRDAAKRGTAVRTPLDETTVKALGATFANRIKPEAYVKGHPDYAKVMGLDVSLDSDKPSNSGSSTRKESIADEYEGDEDVNEDDDEKATEELRNQLSESVDIPVCPFPDLVSKAAEGKKMTTQECRNLVQHYLADRHSKGETSISVPDLAAMTPPVPRGREWLRQELIRLAGDNPDDVPAGTDYRLHSETEDAAGMYTIVAPVLTGR